MDAFRLPKLAIFPEIYHQNLPVIQIFNISHPSPGAVLLLCGIIRNFAAVNESCRMPLKPVLHWCRRYLSLTLLASLAVAAYVLFLNDNSVMRTYEHEREIARLEEAIRQATDTLEYYRALNASLDTDRGHLERIVREQYHMQQQGEDVYVFEQ